jgi:hypothetical protein
MYASKKQNGLATPRVHMARALAMAGLVAFGTVSMARAEQPPPVIEKMRSLGEAGDQDATEEGEPSVIERSTSGPSDKKNNVGHVLGVVVPEPPLGPTDENQMLAKLRAIGVTPRQEADVDGGDDSESTTHLFAWSITSDGSRTSPIATGEIRSEVEYYDYYSTTNAEDQRTNWLSNVHLEQVADVADIVSVESRMRLVLNSDGENQRFYSDYPYAGAYVAQLKVQYAHKHFSLFGGKYEPAAGLHGHGAIFFGNYSRDLDLDGRLGGGASITGATERLGRHSISAHLFRVDRSRLRGELYSNRWRDDALLAQAGPIGFPKSYLISIDGEKELGIAEFAYTIAAGNQERGTLPEEGFLLAAAAAELPISGLGDIALSLDFMRLRGAGGYQENRRMLGGGVGWNHSDYYVGATYTGRRVFEREARTTRLDHVGEVVARYAISQRTTVESAYQHVYENGSHENALGIVLNYSADWIVY